MATNQVQRRHLRERIDTARRNQIDAIGRRKNDPPANVMAAYAQISKLRKITDAYEHRKYALQRRERDRIVQKAMDAMQKVLFSEPDAALAAVIKFESGK